MKTLRLAAGSVAGAAACSMRGLLDRFRDIGNNRINLPPHQRGLHHGANLVLHVGATCLAAGLRRELDRRADAHLHIKRPFPHDGQEGSE